MDYNKYFAQANEEANETYLNYGVILLSMLTSTITWKPQAVHT